MSSMRFEQTAKRHYSSLQRFYDALNKSRAIHLPLWMPGVETEEEANQAAANFISRVSAPRVGEGVLDAGCGLGSTAFWIAQTFGAKVIGVSDSVENVARCRELARMQSLNEMVEFRVADLMGDFAENDAFDSIWSLESLNYLAPKRLFIERVYRTLKPGGVWLCMDRFLSYKANASRMSAKQIRALTTGLYTPDHWEGADELLLTIKGAGFIDAEFYDLTGAVVDLPRKRRASPGQMIRAIVATLGRPTSYAALYRAFRIMRSSYELMERGQMSYGLLSCKKPITASDRIREV